MNLSTQALLAFKEIYNQKFHQQIDDEEANQLGLMLLTFFKLIYRPLPKTQAQVLPPDLPMYEL